MDKIFLNSAIYADLCCNSAFCALPATQIHNNMPNMKIGRAIKALRKEKGLTLESVAVEAGTNTGHLSRIERGKSNPSLELLEKIADAMGVKSSTLMAKAEGGAKEGNDLSDEAIQLRQNSRTLSTDNQRVLVEIAKVLNKAQKR